MAIFFLLDLDGRCPPKDLAGETKDPTEQASWGAVVLVVGWLVGWLVAWLVGWLVGWLLWWLLLLGQVLLGKVDP